VIAARYFMKMLEGGTMSNRSYVKMNLDDLRRLQALALADRTDFFARRPSYLPLADRLIAVTLSQGAALHYVDGVNGIKDLDVWTFYAGLPGLTFPQRRYTAVDFGDPKFGPAFDKEGYVGRRVDLMGRSLLVDYPADPVAVLHKYLSEQRTPSATYLAQKAVVLLEPLARLGEVIWYKGQPYVSGHTG